MLYIGFMNKKISAQIKKELMQKRKEIIAELSTFTTEDRHAKTGHQPNFTNLGDSSDDNAKEVDMYTTNLSVSKVLESTLQDIDAALSRMVGGTYGICKYCGSEISEKRLLARPVSSACIACKSHLQNNG